MTRRLVLIWCLLALVGPALAQRPAGRGGQRSRSAAAANPVVLKPARVFDGTVAEAHEGWIVVVRGQTIEAAGPAGEVKVPEVRPRHRPARDDSVAGTDRRPHPRVASPV